MNNPSPSNPSQPEPLSRHEARQQRRAARRAAFGSPSRGSAWIGGFVLILLGVVFLAQNLGIYVFPLNNWWALFILIPAVGSFDAAYQAYRKADNQLDERARNSLLVGLFLTLLTGTFLFNLNLNILGPVLIILAGVAILINTVLSRGEE